MVMKWIVLFVFMGIFVVAFWLLNWFGGISLQNESTLENHFSHHFNGGILPFVRQDDFMAFLCFVILVSFLVMGVCVEKIKEAKPLKTSEIMKAYLNDQKEFREFIKNNHEKYGIKKIKEEKSNA